MLIDSSDEQCGHNNEWFKHVEHPLFSHYIPLDEHELCVSENENSTDPCLEKMGNLSSVL